MTDRTKARRPICAHPGCSRALGTDNSSGVCRAHRHFPACGCVQCRVRSGVHLPPPLPVASVAALPGLPGVAPPCPPRAGVRVVEIPTRGTTSAAYTLVRVSLPAEPWWQP